MNKRKIIITGISACILIVILVTVWILSDSSFIPNKNDYKIYTEIINDLRIQVLSPTLIRAEVKGPEGFEDRETFHIVNRETWEGDEVSRTEDSEFVYLETSTLNITVKKKSKNLSVIKITDKNGSLLWKFTGLPSNKVDLPEFDKEVFAFAVADTPRAVPSEWGFNKPDKNIKSDTNGWDLGNDADDMYIFLPQNDHIQLRKDFVNLTGKTEMMPLSALGAWDSRYYAYSEKTALKQIEDYHSRNLPLDLLVIDTDWRNATSGMGYEINTKLFPDMEAFLNKAHEKNVMIMFNDHPEPTQTDGSDNNVLSAAEIEYRSESLTKLLNMGLDAWWYDRNWSKTIKPLQGFTHEVIGMALYADAQKKVYPDRRLLMMSNIDGILHGFNTNPSNIAAHRYSVQWTGDTSGGQETIVQELYNTVKRGEVSALPYVSTDLGAHQTKTADLTDAEYIRWIQMGALSPIFRPHVMLNDVGRMPWKKGEEVTDIYREYINLRYRLLPVFYQLSHENYETGLPITRSMKMYYPEYSGADRYDQYMLGDSILVAPVIQENSSKTVSKERTVWIPEGEWIDTITGNTIWGPQTINIQCEMDEKPIYIKKGACIPLADEMLTTKDKDWSHLTLDFYPSYYQDGQTVIYEDDTQSVSYQQGAYRTTKLETYFSDNKNILKINPAEGTFDGDRAFEERSWTIRVHRPEGSGKLEKVFLNGKEVEYIEIAKNTEAFPINNKDGAADGDVYVIEIKTGIREAQNFEFEFLGTENGGRPDGNYDESLVKVQSGRMTDVPVSKVIDITDDMPAQADLTAEGVSDWYFASDGGSFIRKNIDFSKIDVTIPEGSLLFVDYFTRFSWSDGRQKNIVNGSRKGLHTANLNTFFSIDVKSGTKRQELILYIGAWNGTGKLEIFDEADGSAVDSYEIISSGSVSAYRRVSIKFSSEQNARLHIRYTLIDKTHENGNMTFTAAALS